MKLAIGNQLEMRRLRDPRYRHPLCAIETAKAILEMTEDEIGQFIEIGALVAFDIRSPDAAGHEWRILTASITEFLRDNLADSEDYVSAITPEQAVALVLAAVKHGKPWLTRKEISRLLNCGRQHAVNLVERKSLPLLPGTTYRPGPNGSPLVPRAAFTSWLSRRLEGSLS